VEEERVVVINPSNGFVPMRSDAYPAFRDMRRRREVLMYEVAAEEVRGRYRADVTVVEANVRGVRDRFPVYLEPDAARARDLRKGVSGRLGSEDFSVFYMTERGPTEPIGDDEEMRVNCRIVAQMGRIDPLDGETEMFLRVLYTDAYLFGAEGDDDVPFVLKVARPILWRDARGLFAEKSATLVRRGRHFEKVTADEDYVIDGTKGEMVAIVYDIGANDAARAAVASGPPLRMRKEFQEGADEQGTDAGEEDEEEEEEATD
jgi:hypothetical protein